MGDYTVSLNAKQEHALQVLTDAEAVTLPGSNEPITITKAEMVNRLVLVPVKTMVRQLKALDTLAVTTAYAEATDETQTAIRAALGL